jgi:hypothetical protein
MKRNEVAVDQSLKEPLGPFGCRQPAKKETQEADFQSACREEQQRKVVDRVVVDFVQHGREQVSVPSGDPGNPARW